MAMFQPLSVALGASTSAAAIRAATAQLFSNRVAYGAGGDAGLTAAGTYTFTVPAGVYLVRAKLWGAPGGNAGQVGGPGGFVEADIPVTPGEALTVIVPSPGGNATASPVAGTPGGGLGDSSGYGASGGGYAAVRRGTTDLALAGGGGGGSDGGRGGSGGGTTGQAGQTVGGMDPIKNGQGGTQSAGGLNGDSGGPTAGKYQGANFQGGGAGGGGLYGGGSGTLQNGIGRGGGGGGSGSVHPTAATQITNVAGDGEPPKMADADYGGNAGRVGYPGRVVIRY